MLFILSLYGLLVFSQSGGAISYQKGFIVRTKYSVDPDQPADLDQHCFY